MDFDGFNQWFLLILISGFEILMCGLMITTALFFLCLIVDGG